MRQFFRMLLLALVLMTVALVSALTAMRLAIHGREVTIPKLVGMSPSGSRASGRSFGTAGGGRAAVLQRGYSRRKNHDPDAAAGNEGAARLVDPGGAKSGAAAGDDSRRHGRERAGCGVEHTAPRAQSRFGRAHQFAGRAARPGDIAKPAGECQRRVGTEDQSAGQRRSRAGNLS